jgi:hypothetical protein
VSVGASRPALGSSTKPLRSGADACLDRGGNRYLPPWRGLVALTPGTPVRSRDAAGRDLTCCFARQRADDSGLAWPGSCRSWPPVWLPGTSLPASASLPGGCYCLGILSHPAKSSLAGAGDHHCQGVLITRSGYILT